MVDRLTAARLARLEQRQKPARDPRRLEEARKIVLTRILGLAATLEPAEEPDPDFALTATLTALVRHEQHDR